jgi:hypothetical protein
MTRPDLATLLRVQERDAGLDRLRYRRSTLPERDSRSRPERKRAAIRPRSSCANTPTI